MERWLLENWQGVVPDIASVLRRIDEKSIIAVGALPYPRIIPAFFLRNYQVYCFNDVADIDILRPLANIACLEEKAPKVAKKVHATSYLLRNYVFQAFLKSRQYPFQLMFYQTTPPIVKILQEQGIEWIGNDPTSFEPVLYKAGFRDVLRERNLPRLDEWRVPREQFLAMTFEELFGHWNGPVVVQRADVDVSNQQGTFFIHTPADWAASREILAHDERYHFVQISPFVRGNSLSMLGCVTHLGVLTSTLQLQLIDVPQVINGRLPTGLFLGHDWGFTQWNKQAETTAQTVVESIGEYLAQRGFRGVFGVDFMHDTTNGQLYPLECNPRFTGALTMYSLMMLQQTRVPPLEFFHIMAHNGMTDFFDFDAVNRELKRRLPLAHISLSPLGIYDMKLPLRAGVYRFVPATKKLQFRRPGAYPWDIQEPDEFLLIDSVPRLGKKVPQNVPRIFKLIFNHSIAQSSYEVTPTVGTLISSLTEALRRDQVAPPLETAAPDNNGE